VGKVLRWIGIGGFSNIIYAAEIIKQNYLKISKILLDESRVV
jgi:hypothetical protein